METSLRSDSRIDKLLTAVVTKFSSDSGTGYGSLARGLGNSPKLKGHFRATELKELDEIAEIKQCSKSLHWAQHRFDTVTAVLRIVVLRISTILQFLIEIRSMDGKAAPWAADLLDNVFTTENLILLSLIAEWSSTVSGYVHRWDNLGRDSSGNPKRNPIGHLAFVCRSMGTLKKDLGRLFEFDIKTNKPPLVMDQRFTKGFVQILRGCLTGGRIAACTSLGAGGKVLYRGLSDDDFQATLLKEMGSIKNVSRVYLQELKTEHEVGLGQGFGAFDMESSTVTKPETLDELAKLFGATVSLLLTLFESTGVLEQNLAALRGYGHEQKQSMTTNTRKPKPGQLPDIRLPKRMAPGKVGKTGMAALMRIRQEQKDSIEAAGDVAMSGMDPTKLESCLETVNQSAAERTTAKQKKLSSSLADRVTAKIRLLTNLDEVSRQKLREQVNKENERLTKLRSIQVRDLRAAECMTDCSKGLVIAVPTVKSIEGIDRMAKETGRILKDLGGPRVVPLTATNLVKQCLEASFTVWYGLTDAAEDALLFYKSETSPELSTAMSRLLGGHVAGPTWLRACQQAGKVVRPVTMLGRALQIGRQLGFDASVQFREGLLKVISAVESHPAGTREWVVRSARSELSRSTAWWIVAEPSASAAKTKKKLSLTKLPGKEIRYLSFLHAITQHFHLHWHPSILHSIRFGLGLGWQVVPFHTITGLRWT
ncbi:unnamed protein product [Symbiodinium sp. CCMP2592]|nr:unnamed protein product [Symbiodinium sp. CCMP2592]